MREPCRLFLCVKVNTLLKYTVTTPRSSRLCQQLCNPSPTPGPSPPAGYLPYAPPRPNFRCRRRSFRAVTLRNTSSGRPKEPRTTLCRPDDCTPTAPWSPCRTASPRRPSPRGLGGVGPCSPPGGHSTGPAHHSLESSWPAGRPHGLHQAARGEETLSGTLSEPPGTSASQKG